jgi:hypothetical protein
MEQTPRRWTTSNCCRSLTHHRIGRPFAIVRQLHRTTIGDHNNSAFFGFLMGHRVLQFPEIPFLPIVTV